MNSFNISIIVYFFNKGLNIRMKVWAFVSVLVLWFLFYTVYPPAIWFASSKMDLSVQPLATRAFHCQIKFCSFSSQKVYILHGNVKKCTSSHHFNPAIRFLALTCGKDWKKVTERPSVSENHLTFTSVSLGARIPLHQLTTQEKEVLRKSKNNDKQCTSLCLHLGTCVSRPCLRCS